ncbi:hypothetical protein ACTD5D_21515 [Nocardia takedensis]|uniref:hypothetical protein n=1 Tax=Nocardia takedensis TaxID=259390 RepID=UPI003F759D71
MPTVWQVRSWQPWLLAEAGQQMRRRSEECVALVEQAVTRIRDAGAYWQGEAYYAAYDRVAQDRDQAKKASQDIESLARTMTEGADLLTGYRQSLLDKVADATTAGFTVTDDWTVTAASGAGADSEHLHTHRTAVSTALQDLLGVQSAAATRIEQANTEVTSRAEQIGPAPQSASPVSQALGSAQTDPTKTTAAAAGIPASTAAPAPGSGQAAAGIGGSRQQLGGSATTPSQAATAYTPGTGTAASNSAAAGAGSATLNTGAARPGGAAGSGTGNTGAALNSNAASTLDKGKPGEWRPGDISDLIKAVSTITGNLPDLIESSGEFLKDTGELIKTGGETAAKITDSVTKLVTAVDHAAHPTTSDHPTTSEQAVANHSTEKSATGNGPITSDKNTTTPAPTSDKTESPAASTAEPAKTRSADWTSQNTPPAVGPPVENSANHTSAATTQPMSAPVFPTAAATRRNSGADRARPEWSLDLPNPTAQKQSV